MVRPTVFGQQASSASAADLTTPQPASGFDEAKMQEAAVLYILGERQGTIEIGGLTGIGPQLRTIMTRLYVADLVTYTPNETHYVLTDKGKAVLHSLVDLTAIALKHEVFAKFDLSMDLSCAPILAQPGQVGDIADPDNPGMVVPLAFDPRFVQEGDAEPAAGTEDLRLAVIEWLNATLPPDEVGGRIDPRAVIFLQHIGSGRYDVDSPAFWQSVADGTIAADIDAIIASAYKWTDIGGGDVELSRLRMTVLYKAGMAEMLRKKGDTCGGCKVPLGVIEDEQARYGKTVDDCPACGRHFGPPPAPKARSVQVSEYECPNCNAAVSAGQSRCSGCSAGLDFPLPEGAIRRTTVTRREVTYQPVFGWRYAYGYGYRPPVLRYHYDPLQSAWEYRRLASMHRLW